MAIMRPGGDNIRDESITSADIKDGTIMNSDINASAGIAYSKLAGLNIGKALITDSNGFITTSAVTSTEVAYLNGVNSGIQNQINNKASLESPSFTGNPTAPTQGLGDNTTKIATTGFVQGLINQVNTGNYSPVLAGNGLVKTDNTLSIASSLALTGIPTAPTADRSTNTTQIATTAFVKNELEWSGLMGSEIYVDKRYSGTINNGTIHRPYKSVQAAINAAFQAGFTDVTIIVKSGTEYTEDLLIDRNQLGPNNAQVTHLAIIGLSGANDSANIKINGTVTISGAMTTRVKLQNIQFAATAGVAGTALVVDGTDGRHVFTNCVFTGKVVFTNSWKRWSVFRGGSNYGFDIGGTPGATETTPSVIFHDTGITGASTVSTGTVVVQYCGSTYGITHSGGTLAILKSNFSNTGLTSTASLSATTFLFMQDVSFFNGTSYATLNKSGTCYYVFNNVSRAGTETINGTRFKLGASSSDFQFRPATPSQFGNLSELSVKQALDSLGTGVSSSDMNLKEDIQSLNELELNVAKKLKSLVKKYKFKDDLEGKIHVGVIAQEVIEVFESEGLNVDEYGIVQRLAKYDLNGESQEEILGVAYNQLFAFIISAL